MLFAIFAFVTIFCWFLPVTPMAKTICAIVGLILIVLFAFVPGALASQPLMAPTGTHFHWKL